MNEDEFNMSIRKFLKTVGVTAQREIEKAVREAAAAGRLKGVDRVMIEARIKAPGVALDVGISGEIDVR